VIRYANRAIWEYGKFLLVCAHVLTFAFLFTSNANAKPIIADISEYTISISSDFTGKKLLLFGARNDPGDIIVVVRGPERQLLIRKKEPVAGIWINTQQARFLNVPYYYAITGTRHIEEIASSATYKSLNIGINNLDFDSLRPLENTQKTDFMNAFMQTQQLSTLYQNYTSRLQFMGDTLFKTQIDFPDNLPRGNYAVDIYLFEDGQLKSMQTLPIIVSKVGFDAFVYDLAHDYTLVYGLIAIFIAVAVGWGVSLLFNRIW